MQELATGYGLIEGPVWDPAKGLYFSDVLGGGIYLLDREDKVRLPFRNGAVSAAWPCMPTAASLPAGATSCTSASPITA